MNKLITIVLTVLLVCSCSTTPKEKPFEVDLKSPRYTAGSAEAYMTKAFSLKGTLAKTDLGISYYPVEDAVCLEFKVLLVRCQQFWDRDGREAFVNAFERYKGEYERRELKVTKNKKVRGMYGDIRGYFAWKKTPVSVHAHAPAIVRLGYQFKDRSAFFTTTQMEAYYEDSISRTRSQTSPVTIMFFTRAQAEALIELFNQDYLRTLGLPGGSAPIPYTEVDEY